MIIKPPTHFRFKNEKEAKEWNQDTKTWHKIEDMKCGRTHCSISSDSFAWVGYSRKEDNLEFKIDESKNPTVLETTFDKKLISKYYKERRQGYYYQIENGIQVYFSTYKEMDAFNDKQKRPNNDVVEIDEEGRMEEYMI